MRARLFTRVWVRGAAEVTSHLRKVELSKFINSEERARMMSWRGWRSGCSGWYRRGMSLLLSQLTSLDVVVGINWNKLVFARIFFVSLSVSFSPLVHFLDF